MSTNEKTKSADSAPQESPSKQLGPARVQQSGPARVQQSNPARVRQSSPARVRQSSPARVQQSSPARVRQSNPAHVQQSSPARVQQSTQKGTIEALLGAAALVDQVVPQPEVFTELAVTTRATKWTLKQLQAQEQLELQTLADLSPKYLRVLFSEQKQSQNEYSNRFCYECKFYIEEGQCKKTFTGYRDESSVFAQIEKHLQDHVKEEQERNNCYVTTSVQFRNKQKGGSKKKSSSNASSKKPKKSPTVKKGSPGPECMNDQSSGNSNDSSCKQGKRKRSLPDDKETLLHASSSDNCPREEDVPVPSKQARLSSENEARDSPEKQDEELDTEKFWTSALLDHTYTAMPGSKPKQGSQSPVSDVDSEDFPLTSEAGTPEKPESPSDSSQTANKLELDVFPEATQEETIAATMQRAAEDEGDDLEEEAANDKDERKYITPRRKIAPVPDEVKDAAMKHIADLQNKRKENQQLICLMCNDGKEFTAQATLLNHYKSHAGIKSFECELCGDCFTRKHSLKYHVMIHEGKVPFTCPYCQNGFRHRAHFKEHKRQHTGETPFVCTDCKMRFRTRNTYKRHLRTHHGKILTHEGVYIMTAEEFDKEKTKKYKTSVKSEESSSGGSTASSAAPSPEPVVQEQKRPRKVAKKSTNAPPKRQQVAETTHTPTTVNKAKTKKYKTSVKSEESSSGGSTASSAAPSPDPVVQEQKRPRKVAKKSTNAPPKRPQVAETTHTPTTVNKAKTKKYKTSVKSEESSSGGTTASSAGPSPEPVVQEQKRPRKVAKKSTNAPPKRPQVAETTHTPTTVTRSVPVSLPAVGSLLMTQIVPHSQSSTGLSSVVPHSLMHVGSNQASVGVLPPMASIGMTVSPGFIYTSSTPGLPLGAQSTFVTNAAPTVQPNVTLASDSQGQTYYTLTAFPSIQMPAQAEPQRDHAEVDMRDYKAVGYMTHN